MAIRERALRHQVRGWVKNRKDGAVEALLQGQKSQAAHLIDWARLGPPESRVVELKARRVREHPRLFDFQLILDGQSDLEIRTRLVV